MKTVYFIVSILLIGLLNSQRSFATEACAEGHCSKISVKLNSFCIENGMAGKPYLVFGPDGQECECPCSCVVSGTQIELANGFEISVEDIQLGDSILNPLTHEKTRQVESVLMSEVSAAPLIELVLSNGRTLRVSHNHVLFLANGSVTNAVLLKEGDHVKSGRNEAATVTVLRAAVINYTGKLWNVILASGSTVAKDHVLVTEQVLSGDWLLQANVDAGSISLNVLTDLIKIYSHEGVSQ